MQRSSVAKATASGNLSWFMAVNPTHRAFVMHHEEITMANAATISVTNPAIQSGVGLFDTLAAYQGHLFAAEQHFERLHRGAERLGLSVSDPDTLRSRIERLLIANHLNDAPKARVRTTVLGANQPGKEDEVLIEATLATERPDHASVITIPFSRNEKGALSGIKTVSYGENLIAMHLAREANADEALFANTQGKLCEGTWSNIFVRIDGRWTTPPLDSGCLPGITREILLELAADTNQRISESTTPIEALANVEAAFLTSSIREIQAISSINGRRLDPEFDTEIRQFHEALKSRIRQSKVAAIGSV